MRPLAVALALLLAAGMVGGQLPEPPEPDFGPVSDGVNQAVGTVLPPILDVAESSTGQQLDREDIRLLMDMDFTKGEVNLLGFLVGSGRTEIEAKVEITVEMRVISTDRVRALIEGENFYNVSADNASFLNSVYLPADLFRATLTGEAFREFQDRQEEALATYVQRTFPELQMRDLQVQWRNTSPTQVSSDDSLFEPPIIATLQLGVEYVRVDSLERLLRVYFSGDDKVDGKKSFIKDLKKDAGDPLRSRDFFSAVAYTQLLNLTAQPGWAIDVNLSLPVGYEFTYFNGDVVQEGPTRASLHLDALDREQAEHKVFLASISHKRGVALTMFFAMWVVGLLLATPARFFYVRRRMARLSRERM